MTIPAISATRPHACASLQTWESVEFNTTAANLKLIRETLEAAGVEFIGSADEGPGVRLWRR